MQFCAIAHVFAVDEFEWGSDGADENVDTEKFNGEGCVFCLRDLCRQGEHDKHGGHDEERGWIAYPENGADDEYAHEKFE